jgi:lipopolysaccharide/colanic/teichoic acid biosynthesis glycosyltransferase/CheY-like chemotaxis protein
MEETENVRLKILYVGNDQKNIDLLQNSGLFDLTQKKNGLTALYWLTENKLGLFDLDKETKSEMIYPEMQQIDAIVCEYGLPGINGLSFFQKFKVYKVYQKTPFILLSLRRDDQLKMEAFNSGLDDYYQKELDPGTIYHRILSLISFKAEYTPVPLNLKDEEMTPYKTPFLKRSFDILIALFALLILSPLMLLTIIAIRLESRGRVYYLSKRVGSNYRIFDFYKFRSMYPDADKRLKEVAHLNQYISETVEDKCTECAKLPDGKSCSPLVYFDGEEICERLANKRRNVKKAFLKIKDDPRITKVGKFIRMTSIDELPQLFNVLKGDMSIVGNRPLPLNEAEALTKKKWSRRFRAAAGLTGLWQVEKRGRTGSMSEEERFALDNYYAEHNSFWNDLKIIFRTFTAIIQKENV